MWTTIHAVQLTLAKSCMVSSCVMTQYTFKYTEVSVVQWWTQIHKERQSGIVIDVDARHETMARWRWMESERKRQNNLS